MHCRSIVAAGYDLHRVFMTTVAADRLQMPAICHEHAVPAEQGIVVQRIRPTPVQISHHLCNAAFTRLHRAIISVEAKLPAQGRLHAQAIQGLTLYRAGLDRLFAKELNSQLVAVIVAHMADRADHLTGEQQEVALQRFKGGRIIGKMRPTGLRPIPCHER